ncbi:MAG: VanW family protein [Mycobacteriales bacterium]
MTAPPDPVPAIGRSGVRWRPAALAGAGVVVLLLLLYLAGALRGGSDIPAGVRVGTVDLGGKSRPEALRLVQAAYGDRAARPMEVQGGDRRLPLDPRGAGLQLDPAATVADAAARPMDPLSVLRRLFGLTRRVQPAVAVDRSMLDAAVDRLAGALDTAGGDGAIRFDGITPVTVEPRAGQRLDRPAAAEALRSAYLRSTGAVRLSMTSTAPKVSAAEILRVLREVAQPAVAAPVALTAGSRTVVVAPADIAATLTFVPTPAGLLVPHVDGAALNRRLASRLAAVQVPPHDAYFRFVAGRPVIVAAVTGRTVYPEDLSLAMVRVLPRPAPRAATVALRPTPPRLSTAAVHALGVREVIGSFTTHHPCCRPRVTNIHRMADIVNGALVLPGQTFSLNGYVGERDTARGFVSAPMIDQGSFVDAVGGGVSQFATTIFNAVFFAGLKDVQHTPHSYYISRYPAGRESTISYPQPDFRFTNDSPYGVLIQTAYTGTSLTVTFWGTKRYEIESVSGPRYAPTVLTGVTYNPRPDCEASGGSTGFSINVTRIFLSAGREVKRETFHTRYLPEPHVICGGSPAPTPSPPSPSPSPVSPSPTPAPSATPTH